MVGRGSRVRESCLWNKSWRSSSGGDFSWVRELLWEPEEAVLSLLATNSLCDFGPAYRLPSDSVSPPFKWGWIPCFLLLAVLHHTQSNCNDLKILTTYQIYTTCQACIKPFFFALTSLTPTRTPGDVHHIYHWEVEEEWGTERTKPSQGYNPRVWQCQDLNSVQIWGLNSWPSHGSPFTMDRIGCEKN